MKLAVCKKIAYLIGKIVHYGEQFFAPSYCVGCHVSVTQGHFLCQPCLGSIKPVATVTLPVTQKWSVCIHSVSFYQQPLISLVSAKYYGNRLAAQQLGFLMWQRTSIAHLDFDYIVPVPLHWSRYAWRWYNQTEEMARVISSLSGKPIVFCVKRIAYNKPQASLSRDERSENMTGVFALSSDALLYKGKKILIVDDVVTSGATLRQMVYCLSKINPAQINAVVACRMYDVLQR